MVKRNSIFDLSGISIIACDCLQAVICIFIDLFFVSKILKSGVMGETGIFNISNQIMTIGLFYIVEYSVLTFSYFFSGFLLRKINKSFFVSIGSILLGVTVLLVYLLQNSLMTFAPLIAAVYGLAWAFYSAGYHNLTAETISSKHQVKFFAVKKIMYQLVFVAFPISLGLVADIDFSLVTYIMFGISALLIIFSFLIRPKKSIQMEFNLPKFTKYLYQNRKQLKPLWCMYIQNFFRGASYDCFTTLVTILVFTSFQSNSSLGMFQSIFNACSLLTIFFYLKYYRKKRAVGFIGTIISLVACTVIAILSSTNQITILLFYGIYATLNVVLMSVSDSRRSGVVRVLSLHSHILESSAIGEFFLGAGRLIGSLLIVLAGVFDAIRGGGTLFLKIDLALTCVFYICYGLSIIFMEKTLIKQDEEFRQAHLTESIEKVED